MITVQTRVLLLALNVFTFAEGERHVGISQDSMLSPGATNSTKQLQTSETCENDYAQGVGKCSILYQSCMSKKVDVTPDIQQAIIQKYERLARTKEPVSTTPELKERGCIAVLGDVAYTAADYLTLGWWFSHEPAPAPPPQADDEQPFSANDIPDKIPLEQLTDDDYFNLYNTNRDVRQRLDFCESGKKHCLYDTFSNWQTCFDEVFERTSLPCKDSFQTCAGQIMPKQFTLTSLYNKFTKKRSTMTSEGDKVMTCCCVQIPPAWGKFTEFQNGVSTTFAKSQFHKVELTAAATWTFGKAQVLDKYACVSIAETQGGCRNAALQDPQQRRSLFFPTAVGDVPNSWQYNRGTCIDDGADMGNCVKQFEVCLAETKEKLLSEPAESRKAAVAFGRASVQTENNCTAADQAEMNKRGGGTTAGKFPFIAYNCGYKSAFSADFETSYISCMAADAGLTESCGSCFARAGLVGKDHCSGKCFYYGWSSEICQTCTQTPEYGWPATRMQECVGKGVVLPSTGR